MSPRSPVLIVLVACAAGLFLAAFRTADRIPAGGDPRLEAMSSGFSTAGATVLGGAVTLAAVVWALNLESRRAGQERYMGHQVDLTREAADWLRTITREAGHIYGAAFEVAAMTNGPNKTNARTSAERRAERFIDDGQQLYEAERLASLIDDSDVVSALGTAVGLLGQWNEIVTDGSLEIAFPDPLAELAQCSDGLSELHRAVEARLTQAVRQSWT